MLDQVWSIESRTVIGSVLVLPYGLSVYHACWYYRETIVSQEL